MTDYWLHTEWYNIHTKQKAVIVAKNGNGVFTLAYKEPLLMDDTKILETNWSETLFQQHWRTTDQDLSYDEGKTHILGGETTEGWVCAEDCWCIRVKCSKPLIHNPQFEGKHHCNHCAREQNEGVINE